MKLSREQKTRLLNHKGSLEMVQFLNFKSNSNGDIYFDLSRKELTRVGGKRRFILKVDMILSGMKGKGIPYSFVIIDFFESSTQLVGFLSEFEEQKKELDMEI